MSSSPEVQEIKDKIAIADLIGEYLRLTPAGAGIYKALCPFHNEKTPSMIVSPARQSFHCFGCGAGGDIFEFLMKMENLEFYEALKILAQKAGVVLPRQNREQLGQKSRLYDLCGLAAKYWHKILLDSPQAAAAREYLAARGLTEESIEDFRIGYAIDDWSNLIDFLRKRNFSDNEIFAAGFSVRKDNNRGYYDRFRNRIMFPIMDQNGRDCGFTGRTLNKDEQAKYVNSPQTEIYSKSNIIFGLHQAKGEIRKADFAVIVEGQMDAISCHQHGFKNTVASSGTALTIEQFKLLKRYTNNIYLALDDDWAGRDANSRGEELIRSIDNASRIVEAVDQSGKLSKFVNADSSLSLKLKILTIPFGKDPDECLRNNPDDWSRAIKEAQHPMEYFWKILARNSDLNNLDAKKKIANFFAEKISNYSDPVEKDYWTHEISSRLAIRDDALRELAWRLVKPLKAGVGAAGGHAEGANLASKTASGAISPQKQLSNRDLLMFRRILAIIWAYPELLAKLPEILTPEMIADDLLRGIYNELILFYTKNNGLFTLGAEEREEQNIFDQFITQVKNQAANPSAIAMLEQSYLLAQKDFFALPLKDAKIELDNMLKLLKSGYLKSKISRLKSDLEQAEKRGDKPVAESIYNELSELVKQIEI